MEPTTRIDSPASTGKPSLNPDALNQLVGQTVSDLGAAVNGALVVLGDQLGIYTALAEVGRGNSSGGHRMRSWRGIRGTISPYQQGADRTKGVLGLAKVRPIR
jgi:hypothetical protein